MSRIAPRRSIKPLATPTGPHGDLTLTRFGMTGSGAPSLADHIATADNFARKSDRGELGQMSPGTAPAGEDAKQTNPYASADVEGQSWRKVGFDGEAPVKGNGVS